MFSKETYVWTHADGGIPRDGCRAVRHRFVGTQACCLTRYTSAHGCHGCWCNPHTRNTQRSTLLHIRTLSTSIPTPMHTPSPIQQLRSTSPFRLLLLPPYKEECQASYNRQASDTADNTSNNGSSVAANSTSTVGGRRVRRCWTRCLRELVVGIGRLGCCKRGELEGEGTMGS